MKKTKNKKGLILIVILIFIIILVCVLGLKSKEKVKNENHKDINNTVTNMNNINENEYQTVSKYNANLKKYQDIKVRILNIERGEEAEKSFKEYSNNEKNYQIKIDKKEGEELLIVEYEINFMDFDMGTVGTTKDVQTTICQSEGQSFIKYDDKIYVSQINFMNNAEFTKEKIAKGKFVATIPVGCTDYKIQMGVVGENVKYFPGK